MNIEDVRDAGLSLPHTTERCPYGADCLVLEIGGKQFCLLDLTGEWGFYNLKINPDYSIALRTRYEGIRPGFHMNKRHWVSIDFHGDIPESLQHALIRHAYFQTAKGLPKKTLKALGIDPSDDRFEFP